MSVDAIKVEKTMSVSARTGKWLVATKDGEIGVSEASVQRSGEWSGHFVRSVESIEALHATLGAVLDALAEEKA